MPLVCGRQPRATSLWLWWYSGMVLAGFGFLFWRAVVKCGEFNTSGWRASDRPVLELYVYIALIVTAVVCVPLFLISSLVKVDNMANDGVKLGRDGVREALGKAHTEEGDAEAVGRCQGVWQRLGPVAPALHVVTAFCFLLPRVLLEAQEIRHQLVPLERIWSTELDFMFGTDRINPTNFSRRMVRSRKEDHFSKQTDDVNFTTYQPMALHLTSKVENQNEARFSSSFPLVSPELVNYIAALCIYSVRYAAVFWFTNKGFTLLFSTQALAALVNYVFAYCGFSVMYKYTVNQDGVLSTLRLSIPHTVLAVLFVLACTFVFFSSVSIFNLGYLHFCREYRTFLSNHRAQAPGQGLDDCCHGYAPHCLASIMLLLIATCKAPLVFCYITWHHVTRDNLVMACVIIDVLYSLFWVILWLGFTIKQNWTFYIVKPIVKVYTIPDDHEDCEDVVNRPYSSLSFNNNIETDFQREIDTPSDEGIRVDSNTELDQIDNVTSTERAVTEKTSHPHTQPNNEPDNNRTSVTSALRRSGVRKQKNNNVRVTFENYEATHPGDSPHDTLRSVKSTAHDEPRRPLSSNVTDVPMRRTPRDPPLSRDNPNRRSDPGPRAPILPGCDQIKPRFFNETPENTLTRNYKHNIKNMCDQYYININTSPNNEHQSSPTLSNKHAHQPDISDGRTTLNERIIQYRGSNGHINKRNESPSHDFQSRHTRSRDGTDIYRNIAGSSPQLTSDQFTNDLTRELKIITKPEMGGRDSAVPSSNETSSNDSEDPNVLCSQV